MSAVTTEAIRKSVLVDAAPEAAFRAFTEGIGRWWPLEVYSVFRDPNGTVTGGEEIVESASDGRTAVWGELIAVEAPFRIVYTWHPGRAADDQPTEVEVTFTAEGAGTRVDLEHRGWERLDDQRRAGRAGYDEGWPEVLGAFKKAGRAA